MTSELVPPKPTAPRPRRFDRFLPPTPLARKLSLQSVLFAVGEGAFITGSAVFFTHLPDAEHDTKPVETDQLINPGALRNKGYLALSACDGILGTNQVLLNIVIPLWLGHVTVTGAELFQSAGSWGFHAELSDPGRLGEYQGASHLGHTVGSVWAPAVYTYLAMEWGAEGWLVIARIVVLGTLGMRPSSRAAERYLRRDAPPQPA